MREGNEKLLYYTQHAIIPRNHQANYLDLLLNCVLADLFKVKKIMLQSGATEKQKIPVSR